MKKSITILALLAGAVGAYAQGTLTFGDYGNGFTIDVFSPQLLTPGVSTHGNSPYDAPVGATVYTGVGLGGSATGTGPTAYGNGALWTVALYAAPGVNNSTGLAAAELAGTPIVTSLFQTSGGTGVLNTGTAGADSAGVWALNFESIAPTVFPGFTGGATLQLEAWYNGGASKLTYAASPTSGSSIIGEIAALGGTGSPPATTPNLAASGITSFSLTTTPEPSTIALGVIGASTFLFRRRK
jgi:hypothetical protein